MKTSQAWIDHFSSNIKIQRIDWQIQPSLKSIEKKNILSALKAWQLGETSDGSHLLKASKKYSEKINDGMYLKAVELFIKEEQKHGNNLGIYLTELGKKILKKIGQIHCLENFAISTRAWNYGRLQLLPWKVLPRFFINL